MQNERDSGSVCIGFASFDPWAGQIARSRRGEAICVRIFRGSGGKKNPPPQKHALNYARRTAAVSWVTLSTLNASPGRCASGLHRSTPGPDGSVDLDEEKRSASEFSVGVGAKQIRLRKSMTSTVRRRRVVGSCLSNERVPVSVCIASTSSRQGRQGCIGIFRSFGR